MRSNTISQVVLIAALLAGLGSAVSSNAKIPAPATQTQSAAVAVRIDNFSFGPQEITVAPGTKVTWTNRDDIPHTVVSTNQLFKSKALDTDDQFSFTFDKPGTYEYFCSIHPKMTGKVIVK
ncbi:MAG TPA: cupredoxin family copper-binding protein [Candidatus Limnocylindrales bacterium]|nr:cupredoxin family copper-binding protein [Candidatus Limnocylindrales bacterium]